MSDHVRHANSTQVVDIDVSAARSRGLLTVVGGPEAGRVLPLTVGEVVTLGRVGECTYAFDDPSLSREHARLIRIGNDWILKDAGSTNGTFVNDKRLKAAHPLSDGDRLQLGSATKLRFALVDEAEEAALRNVYEAASKDGLTGIFNRKHLEERIVAELAFAQRHSTPLSVIISDVDHFKKVNDTYGHLGGDAVLKEVALRLTKAIRPEDILARYGGEEFVVLCRGTDLANAAVLAERLRQGLSAQPVFYEGKPIPITASAGVASLVCCATAPGAVPGALPGKAQLLGLADERLYKAKQSGRNRVIAG